MTKEKKMPENSFKGDVKVYGTCGQAEGELKKMKKILNFCLVNKVSYPEEVLSYFCSVLPDETIRDYLPGEEAILSHINKFQGKKTPIWTSRQSFSNEFTLQVKDIPHYVDEIVITIDGEKN